MVGEWLVLLTWLVVIVGGCVLFTNGVEWLGRRLDLGEGAVGSVLAAVGTAMPETLVGIVAILWVGKGAGHEIGVGAILGAPLLLSTLALPITGMGVLAFRRRRAQGYQVAVDRQVLARDLRWFYLLFALVILVSLHPVWPLRIAAALLITGGYVHYVRLHLADARGEEEALDPLYFCPRSICPGTLPVAAQCLVALGVIIIGAYRFAAQVKVVSELMQVSPQVLAMIIAPIATELPEKMNSIIWVRQGKDTLALGNITGAMVFQGSVPVVLGILLTEWHLNTSAFAAMLCAMAATFLLTLSMGAVKRLSVVALLGCGAFYVVWLLVTFRL